MPAVVNGGASRKPTLIMSHVELQMRHMMLKTSVLTLALMDLAVG
jgi:hypothetical protein